MTSSQENSAHECQSRSDFGLGFQVTALKTFQVVPSSLGSDSDPTSSFKVGVWEGANPTVSGLGSGPRVQDLED